MDFLIYINTINMELSIVHFKGSQVKVYYFICFSVTDGCFNRHGQGTDGANNGFIFDIFNIHYERKTLEV